MTFVWIILEGHSSWCRNLYLPQLDCGLPPQLSSTRCGRCRFRESSAKKTEEFENQFILSLSISTLQLKVKGCGTPLLPLPCGACTIMTFVWIIRQWRVSRCGNLDLPPPVVEGCSFRESSVNLKTNLVDL